MKIFKRSGGRILFFLIILGFVVPLSPVMSAEATPAQFIEEAKLAIEQARKAEAEQKALDDFTAAKSWLFQAEKSYGDSNSGISIFSTVKMRKVKDDEVVFLATMAKLKAMIATAKANRDATIAKLKDTQKDLADYQSSLAILKEKIAEADKAKEIQAKAEAERKQLEEAQQKLAELETIRKKELQDVRRGTAELEARKEKEVQEAQLKEVQRAAEKEKAAIEAKLKAAAIETQRAKEAMELKAREEKLSEDQRKLAALQVRMQALEREKAVLSAAGNIPNVAVKLGDKKIILTILISDLFTPANDLKPSGKEILNNLGKLLKANTDNKVAVQGHTDSRGKPEVNQATSEKRAQKVREYLVAYQNIPPLQVAAEGLGATQPVATNATETGRSLNRRVEVIIPIR
ncbi:MAG: OmpA family protein [Deltaproteobacteria bacterium]|nr:OmpA family protein [Deltaproteobacteria bacterium]